MTEMMKQDEAITEKGMSKSLDSDSELGSVLGS
jgi:hypothetical protein